MGSPPLELWKLLELSLSLEQRPSGVKKKQIICLRYSNQICAMQGFLLSENNYQRLLNLSIEISYEDPVRSKSTTGNETGQILKVKVRHSN